MGSDRLGRYRVLRELDRGPRGRVLLGHDPEIDRPVAIKTVQVFAALPEDQRAGVRARFLREARAIGRLSHPNIVTLFDAAESEGMLYLVMEYVEGDDLAAHCKPGSLLAPSLVADLVVQTARALHYAHGLGVTHRDVKPANLLRVDASRVKITDFGVAAFDDAEAGQDDSLQGTPGYMSPEQIRGQSLDGRSDLFSLAVVLYELLRGTKPFPGESVPSVIYRIVHDPPVGLDELDPPLAGFLTRALAKDPAERFENGEAFATALEAVAPRAPAPAPASVDTTRSEGAPPVAPPPPASRPARLSVWPFVVGVLVIGAAVAGYVLFRQESAAPPPVKPPPAAAVWEARVRTEPPGVPVLLDAEPLDAGGRVRFSSSGPFGLLTASDACRRVEHRLEPADAGGEIVLVLDPSEMVWPMDPGLDGADVAVNGKSVGKTPVEIRLDLCAANRIELSAPGFRPLGIDVPDGATPTEARALLYDVALAEIPKGTLRLPTSDIELVWYLDGERLKPSQRRLELEEGEHKLRFKNEFHWLDVTRTIRVVGGETVEASLDDARLTTLSVQAFPSNCKVYVKQGGGDWRFLDEAPASRRVAVGRYQVKVEHNATGETRIREVDLSAGDNPPVRVAFGRR